MQHPCPVFALETEIWEAVIPILGIGRILLLLPLSNRSTDFPFADCDYQIAPSSLSLTDLERIQRLLFSTAMCTGFIISTKLPVMASTSVSENAKPLCLLPQTLVPLELQPQRKPCPDLPVEPWHIPCKGGNIANFAAKLELIRKDRYEYVDMSTLRNGVF